MGARTLTYRKLFTSNDTAIHHKKFTDLEKNKDLPYFYAQPKVHKKPMGIRPIVGCISCPTTGLSKFVESNLKNSDEILNIIHSMKHHNNDQLYSLDIVALYTSINIGRLLDAINKIIMKHKHKDMIMESLKIILQFNFFTFGSLLFKQLNGIAMGQSVAPTLAILYVAEIEKNTNSFFKANIRLYKRYIDDVIMIFNSKKNDHRNSFNHFLAKLRSSSELEWTFETGTSINFLDLTIYKDDSRQYYSTRTYQKKINLHLFTTFSSAHTPSTTQGMVTGFLRKFQIQNSLMSDCNTLFKGVLNLLDLRKYLKIQS
eukprot:Awhi_evm3s10327